MFGNEMGFTEMNQSWHVGKTLQHRCMKNQLGVVHTDAVYARPVKDCSKNGQKVEYGSTRMKVALRAFSSDLGGEGREEE